MKTEVTQTPPPASFKPVTLSITFETQDELNAFYTLYNHSNVERFLCNHDAYSTVYEQLRPFRTKAYHEEFCKITGAR
jgi:hypothetical protein